MQFDYVLVFVAVVAAIAHYFIAYWFAPRKAKEAFITAFLEDEDFKGDLLIGIVEGLMLDRPTADGKQQKLIDSLVVRALEIFTAYFTKKGKDIGKEIENAEVSALDNSPVGLVLSQFLSPSNKKKLVSILKMGNKKGENTESTASSGNPFG